MKGAQVAGMECGNNWAELRHRPYVGTNDVHAANA